MMLNNEECTLVAAAYAHRMVKERMEKADEEYNNLIRQIIKDRVSEDVLKFCQEHEADIIPTSYLRFESSELKEIVEVPNPSICLPRFKAISVTEEEIEAIKLARIEVYNVASLQTNFTTRIEALLKKAEDIEMIAEIMPEIMPVLEETVCTKDEDGDSILSRKKHAQQAYQEFKKYAELKLNNPSCL